MAIGGQQGSIVTSCSGGSRVPGSWDWGLWSGMEAAEVALLLGGSEALEERKAAQIGDFLAKFVKW